MQPNYHPLLAQQIKQALGDSAEISPQLNVLLALINTRYAENESALKTAQDQVVLRTNQLMASTSRAYSFLDSINKGFMMCDTSGEVVLTNNSLRKILAQKNPDQTDNINIDYINQLFSPELPIKDLVKQCLETSQPIEKDEVNFSKLVLRVYLAPLLNEAGTSDQQLLGVVVLVEDVTEEKLLNRSKDEFLSIASHELRTPLTAIRGNAALFKKYYGASMTDKDMAEIIDDIQQSSIRLIGIVNDFLDVAALEQGRINMHPENFSIQETIHEVAHELQNMCAEKGLGLVLDPSVESTPSVFGDKQRTKQVIINLVGNSVKFTEHGSITISTGSDDNWVQTVVSDTGRGMSEENQKLLFRKFQQASNSLLTRDTTKGTGLGLYISKLIVEQSGGQIGLLSSEPDKGSSFGFTLPRAK